MELEFAWTSDTPAYLEGVRIAGSPIVSPGLLIELALNLHSGASALSALRFGRPVPAAADCSLVAKLDDGAEHFTVVGGGLSGSTPRTTTYATGVVGEVAQDERIERLPWRDSGEAHVGAAVVHELLANAGISIAPSAQVLQSIRFGDRSCVATIAISEGDARDIDSYVLHPLFVDAALFSAHLVLSRSDSRQRIEGGRQLVAIDALRVLRPAQRIAAVFVTLRGDLSSDVVDVVLQDGAGGAVAEIDGLRFGPLARVEENARAATIARVLRVIPQACGVDIHDLDANLARLGLSSLDFVRLRSALDGEFGCSPSWNEMMQRPTPRGLAEFYGSDAGAERSIVEFVHDASGIAPVSFAQEQLWFLHQLDPAQDRYHIHARLRWKGPFEVNHYETALRLLIDRHAALRSVFGEVDGVPFQRFNQQSDLNLSVGSLAELDDHKRKIAVDRAVANNKGPAFDLTRGPLFRFAIVATSAEDHLLLFTFHHLVMDGWSLELFLRELMQVYSALVVGQTFATSPSRFDYGQYARWERDQSSDEELAPRRAFWRKSLAGLLPINLPRERRSEAVTGASASVVVALSQDVVAGLRLTARHHETTVFTLCCAAYVHLLRCYSGQSTFGIGTVAAGRDRSAWDGIVGLFSRSLLLRFHDVDASQSFRQLVAHVRDVMLQALEHHLPLSEIVKQVDAVRSSADNPLFNVGILQQSWTLAMPTVPGVEVQWAFDGLDGAPIGTSKLDLELILADAGDELRVEFKFRPAIFQEQFVRHMAQLYVELLRSAAEVVEPSWERQPRAEGTELADIAGSWRSTAVPYDRFTTVASLFVERVAATPDRIAVIDASRRLSYRELDIETNRLAHALGARGVRPGDRVGICLDRSVDVVLAMLGVLKLGAAYVPLDPRIPGERLAWITTDSSVVSVLTKRDLVVRLPSDVATLTLEETLSATDDVAPLMAQTKPDGDVYVMYTSGSTGRPKGVAVQSGNLLNFMVGMDACIPDATSGVWLALTPISFDISVLELLWTLTRGFSVVIGDLSKSETQTPDVPGFVDLAMQNGVTHLQCTPSVARILLEDSACARVLGGVRHLLLGGEALSASLAARLRGVVHGTIHNMYGPTETTIWSSVWQVDDGANGILIGHPIANTTFYVLDRDGYPVPKGVCGELCIGGDGVAGGYLNRVEETQLRFVPDRFRPGHRMYRTGDVVRDRGSVGFEWMGRADRQVKVRGNRVELEEIEATLERVPDVVRCVVAIDPSSADQELVAFVVSREHAPKETNPTRAKHAHALQAVLASQARARLPAWMTPSRFVVVDTIPLTQNGKVDQAALFALLREFGVDPVDFVAPRDEQERSIAGAWEEVLGRTGVGIKDNFFASGGSSLGVIRLVSKLGDRGLRIGPDQVFKCQTIEEQAALVRGDVKLPAERDLVQEAMLPDDVQVIGRPAEGPAARPLLTGATGFVGAHLLGELVSRFERVVCLVRGDSAGQASQRLERALEKWGLPASIIEKAIVIAGDLAEPRFGLTDAEWDALVVQIDVIYHCAAEVNFLKPYEQLKRSNVDGTVNVLRLACQSPAKPVHYISTIAVAGGERSASGEPPTESDPLDSWWRLPDGYSRSKWVAERVTQLAAQRGLSVTIYRPGVVIGSKAAARLPEQDALASVLRAIIATKTCFAAHGRQISHLSPVDDVSRMIVRLSLEEASQGQVFHICDPSSIDLSDLLEVLRTRGHDVVEVSDDRWSASVLAAGLDDWGVASRLEYGSDFVVRLDCQRTVEALRRIGEHWGGFDRDLFARMLDALVTPNEGCPDGSKSI